MPIKRIYEAVYGVKIMLNGNLKCSEIKKYLIRYINFDLKRSDMARVAIHLRNCPKCMEKYSTILKRKNELRKVFIEIEKKIRMQNEISSYVDFECEENSRFIVETMLICDDEYKKELKEINSLKNVFKKAEGEILKTKKNNFTQKILARERLIASEKRKILNKFIPLFPHLRHVFAKFV